MLFGWWWLLVDLLGRFQRDMGVVTQPEQRLANAHALSNALLTCLLVPWVLCLLFFTGLHWTYPVDRRAAQGKRGKLDDNL